MDRSRKMGRVDHTVPIMEMRNSNKTLMGRPERGGDNLGAYADMEG